MSSTVERRLKQHGHDLPTAPEALGFYVPVLRIGNLVMTSGQLPMIGRERPHNLKKQIHDPLA